MQKDEALALPAGYELNCLIHSQVFGRKVLSQDEMRAEASGVWEVQPGCSHFMRDFNWVEGTMLNPVFRQRMPRYSESIEAAWQVFLKVCSGLFSQRQRFFKSLQRQAVLDSGDLPAWPDVLVALRDRMPHAFSIAALEALRRDE